MRVKYKRVKMTMPHCGDCGEMLNGNNSIALPYKCSCGIWKSKDYENPWEYVLVDLEGK